MPENVIVKGHRVVHQDKYMTSGFVTYRLDASDIDGTISLVKDFSDKESFLAMMYEPLVGNARESGREELAQYIEKVVADDFKIDIHHMMDGAEFSEEVEEGGIAPSDGYISEVLVDGHISNLGLYDSPCFAMGHFLVTHEVWKQICQNHEVLVNWVNN